MDDLSQLKTETLYTYMRNALATSRRCIGHTKAYMNCNKANAYRDELIKRGEKLPPFDFNTLFPEKEAWADWRNFQTDHGTYNGPGSF